jgi:mannitol-specific phosphotransferase system IIBC component
MSTGRKIAMAVVAVCGLVVIFINIVVMKKPDDKKKSETTVKKETVVDNEKKEDSVTKQMKTYSEQANAHLPQDAGNGITMVNTEVVGDRTFKFVYSLDTKAEKAYKENFDENTVMKALIQKIKTDPVFRPFRTNDVTIICSYVDNKGEVIKELTATPEDYK